LVLQQPSTKAGIIYSPTHSKEAIAQPALIEFTKKPPVKFSGKARKQKKIYENK
jgi:hypothetical protein